MTRYLSNGLRILTAAALSTGLAASAMAQTTGPQTAAPKAATSQPAAPQAASTTTLPAKTAPVHEMKKEAGSAPTAKTGAEVKVMQDGKVQPSVQQAKPAAGATTQHESKAATGGEKKPGG